MKNIKELSLQLFSISEKENCKCRGAHEVCLQCKKCIAGKDIQLPTDFENLTQYIDHTILKADATKNDIKKLCEEADENNFASVCANPTFVELMSFQLEKAKVCTVVGFPLGANTESVKVFETKNAIKNGANEIDIVIKISKLKKKQYSQLMMEFEKITDICIKENAVSKLIIETCFLNNTEIIVSCLLAKKAGFDFVKTSTGMGNGGATIENVKLMREVVGHKFGVKASGGIRDKKTTIEMLKAGANRIGTSRGMDIIH